MKKTTLITAALVAGSVMGASAAMANENMLKDMLLEQGKQVAEQKAEEVAQEAAKEAAKETVKTTLKDAGVTGADAMVDGAVEKAEAIHSEVKEVEKVISGVTEGDLTAVDHKEILMKDGATEAAKALGAMEGVETLGTVAPADMATTKEMVEETMEKSEVLKEAVTAEGIEPAAGELVKDEMVKDQMVKEITSELPGKAPAEEKGWWDTIKGYFN